MKETIIKNVVNQVIKACASKNALEFANLFTSSGIILLANGDSIQGKKNIFLVTQEYFSHLKMININIKNILIEAEETLIEWQWQHIDIVKNETKLNHNLINLKFQDNLIDFWQEKRLIQKQYF